MMYNNFQVPNPQMPVMTQQAPKIFTLEVLRNIEELNYRSAPTNGNPAFFMLENENKIFQIKWNGRTNEISAFNVFPCVEYQQQNNPQQHAENTTENRIDRMEKNINELSAQMSNLIKALGVNNESSTNGNTSAAK